MQLRIDNDELVKWTNRMERLSKNDVPRVVKKTLDRAAMDVKRYSMPSTAEDTFTIRRANFFKANSRVKFAKNSRNLSEIYSDIGFVPLKGTNRAVDDLEQQEHGGRIGGRSFVPLDSARVGKNYKKAVQSKSRLSAINNLARAKNNRARTSKARFFRTAIYVGVGGFFLSEKGIVFRVEKITRDRGLKLTPLYSYRKGRAVKVDKTKFMERASLETAEKLNQFYIDEAQKQIKFRLER